jgi:hypothetical protein
LTPAWRILSPMSPSGRTRSPARTLAVLLIAVAAALCLADVGTPAMVLADSQECLGPACDDQIACGQPAQPLLPSGLAGSLLAVPPATPVDVAPELTAAPSPGPPAVVTTGRPVVPFAPRSPPLA